MIKFLSDFLSVLSLFSLFLFLCLFVSLCVDCLFVGMFNTNTNTNTKLFTQDNLVSTDEVLLSIRALFICLLVCLSVYLEMESGTF